MQSLPLGNALGKHTKHMLSAYRGKSNSCLSLKLSCSSFILYVILNKNVNDFNCSMILFYYSLLTRNISLDAFSGSAEEEAHTWCLECSFGSSINSLILYWSNKVGREQSDVSVAQIRHTLLRYPRVRQR